MSPASAAEPPWANLPHPSHLAVATRSGQVLRGTIDPRTTAEYLWLTATAEGMAISSRIPAADIVKIHPADPVKLPQRWMDSQPKAAQPELLPPAVGRPAEAGASDKDSAQRHPTEVKSIRVFAQLETWNGDPKPDGLRLFVAPRSATGDLVPASGVVTARLVVYRGNWQGSLGGFRQEETWTREISAADFGAHGGIVDLPFRNFRPEFDNELLPLGVLHVRLSVAGQGTFDSTLEDVELRSVAFTRDLELRSRAKQQP